MMEITNTLPDDAHPLLPSADQDGVLPPFEPTDAGDTTGYADASLNAVLDVPVKVQAVLGRARMPVGDLLRLHNGAVIELDRRVGEPVEIFVNNRLIARGEVVLIENMLGVTLTEIVRQAG